MEEWFWVLAKNETWGKIWPILMAGIVAGYAKYWFDNRRERKRQDAVLIRWTRAVQDVKRVIPKQVVVLNNYANTLREGDDVSTHLSILIQLDHKQFDKFDNKDLFLPIGRRIAGGWRYSYEYRVNRSDKYASAAEHNVNFGKSLWIDLLRYQDEFTENRSRITKQLGIELDGFRSHLGSVALNVFQTRPVSHERILTVPKFYETHLAGLVSNPELIHQVPTIVDAFAQEFFEVKDLPELAPAYAHARTIIKLNE